MILQGRQNLEEKIVITFAAEARLTVEELHKKIVRESKRYSLPAIYKELKKLEYWGVVVKEKTRYSLRLPWVLDAVSFAETLSRTYLQNPSAEFLVPKGKEKKTWRFTDLLRLNNFWAQVILMLLNRSTSKTLYTWMPHAWFNLAYQSQEAQYLKSFQRARGMS